MCHISWVTPRLWARWRAASSRSLPVRGWCCREASPGARQHPCCLPPGGPPRSAGSLSATKPNSDRRPRRSSVSARAQSRPKTRSARQQRHRGEARARLIREAPPRARRPIGRRLRAPALRPSGPPRRSLEIRRSRRRSCAMQLRQPAPLPSTRRLFRQPQPRRRHKGPSRLSGRPEHRRRTLLARCASSFVARRTPPQSIGSVPGESAATPSRSHNNS